MLEGEIGFMGYQYYRSITVDHTKVPNTDQTDFPLLVSVTDASLATAANGGHVQNANGYDLVFAADQAGASLLVWEIESYDPQTGALLAWVKVPTLSHTTDTVIYLCYGNAAAGTDQSNKAGTWDASFLAVYHLGNGTTVDVSDATGNLNGTNNGSTAAAGIVGGGASFGGSAYVSLGTFIGIGSGTHTISLWCNPSLLDGVNRRPVTFPFDDTLTDEPLFTLGLTSGTGVSTAGMGGAPYTCYIPVTTTVNAWQKIDGVIDGNNLSVYLNGTLVATKTCTTALPANPIGYLGRYNANYGEYFEGLIDEVRVSTVARSADWIAAEYANQISPSTFYTFSTEQVGKMNPTITWNTPGPITQGTPLSSMQLDAAASVAGTLIYNPPAGAILGTGNQTLSVTFTPTDTADYNPATASVVLQVNPPYYPQFLSAMMAQAGYQEQVSFQTTAQDVDCGFRTAFAWFSGGLQGYPPAPLYNWTIPYTALSEEDSQNLQSFFSQMKGRSGTFAYLDPNGNLCPYSEDFTQSAWGKTNVAVSQNGGISDPFGGTAGSTLTASAADASINTYVLPNGAASGFTLCGSAWVKAAAAQSLQIGFTDDMGTLLQSQTWQLAAGVWTRIWCRIVLTVNSKIKLQIGGGGTWASGIALSLYGAQCSPSLDTGAYAKTPEAYGLHNNVRFDMDTLVITQTGYNQNSATVLLREFAAGS